jgi:hypothetical protein
VSFQVLTVTSTKMAVFWDGRALMMEIVSTSEMSVSFYETTRCNIPDESHLREILKSHLVNLYGEDNLHCLHSSP